MQDALRALRRVRTQGEGEDQTETVEHVYSMPEQVTEFEAIGFQVLHGDEAAQAMALRDPGGVRYAQRLAAATTAQPSQEAPATDASAGTPPRQPAGTEVELEDLGLRPRTINDLADIDVTTPGELLEVAGQDEGHDALIACYGINDDNLPDLLGRARELEGE